MEEGAIDNTKIVDSNGSDHGMLSSFLKEVQVDALVCGGIGMGAQMALAEGRLEYDPSARCNHHGHHHDGE